MLNERYEYRALLTEGYEGLLGKMKSKEKNGLRHPLEILARGMNETLQKAGITPDKEAWYRCMEGFLKVWYQGGFISSPCYEDVVSHEEVFNDFLAADRHNLSVYFEEKMDDQLSLRFSEKEFADKGKLSKQQENVDTNNQSKQQEDADKEDANTNTLRQICYSEMIANALYRGPLRNQVLLVKGADKKTLLKNGLKIYRLDRRKVKNVLQFRLLAIVAFYLQNKLEGQRYVEHCVIDISNYLGMEPYGKASAISTVSDIINKGCILYADTDEDGQLQRRPLFHRRSLNAKQNNIGKMTVDEKWLKDFDVRLWPADQPIPEGYVAFDDYDLRKKEKELQKNKTTKKKESKKNEAER